MLDKLDRLESNHLSIPNNVHHIAIDLTLPKWYSTLINHNNYDMTQISFCSLLGLTYYLTKKEFDTLMSDFSTFLPKGSALVFDYPDKYTFTTDAGNKDRLTI